MTNQEIGRSLASSFVEMAAALDKLPQVEADLNDAHADLDKAKARISFLELQNTELGDKVVALEANLDASTKSASGHQGNVALMLDEVRKVIGQLAVLTDVVDPQPVDISQSNEPTPDPTPAGQSAEMIGGDMSSPAVKQDGVGGDSESLGVSPSPFAPTTSSTGSAPSSTDGDTTTDSGQSDANPTSPSTAQDSGQSSSQDTPSAPTMDANVEGENASTSDANTSHSEPSNPYWLKPSNMTWRDWRDSHNGDIPYWVKDRSDFLDQTAA